MRDAYVIQGGLATRWGRTSLPIEGYVSGGTAVAAFIYGTTKPIASLVGVGTLVEADGFTIRAAPTIILTGDQQLTGGQTLKDRIIKGRVFSSGTGNVVENCEIVGAPAAPTGDTYLVNAGNSTGTLVRHCTLRPQTPSLYWNGVGQKNYTVERCDISRVVDGFSVFSQTTDKLCKVLIRGNRGHNTVQFRPDLANSPSNPRAETHGDWVQVQNNVQDVSDVIIEGNHFDARHEYAVDSYTGEVIASNNKQRSCIMLTPFDNGNSGSTCSASTINNWFDGGVMTLNAGGNNPGGRITVRGNRFERPTETATSGGPGVYASLVIDAGLVQVDVSGNTYSGSTDSVPVKSW